MEGLSAILTFYFVRENVRNGIWGPSIYQKKWLLLGPCKTCKYNFCMTAYYFFWKKILTISYIPKKYKMVITKNIKSESKYTCAHCDYYTSNSCHFNKHILTPKHVKRENDNQKSQKSESKYTCTICNYHTHNLLAFDYLAKKYTITMILNAARSAATKNAEI